MPLNLPPTLRGYRRRAGADPVERWISSMQAGAQFDDEQIGARVVQLEMFCQAHRSSPGELVLSWERFAPDCTDVVRDYLRHNGIDLPTTAGMA